jgi:Outer membrane lipoprotein-sorting protein
MKFLSAVAAIIWLTAIGAAAQTKNALSDAEIQGRQLAIKLLDQRPATNFTQTGVLEIRRSNGTITNIPVVFKTLTWTADHWESLYSTEPLAQPNYIGPSITLDIVHENGQDNSYGIDESKGGIVHGYFDEMVGRKQLTGDQILRPFASSDFWICDLGLEFLHWPGQKILRGDTARGRLCKILESTNPNPSPGGYSRVDSWIDNETLGIVEAKAYDAQGKLLKEFYPKDIKKVNGQWQVGSMEIDNVQTGSRTRLEFDLKK